MKCRKCKIQMLEGKALMNTPDYSEDFGGDKGERGTTFTMTGKAILVNVNKCPQCGHSVTTKAPKD